MRPSDFEKEKWGTSDAVYTTDTIKLVVDGLTRMLEETPSPDHPDMKRDIARLLEDMREVGKLYVTTEGFRIVNDFHKRCFGRGMDAYVKNHVTRTVTYSGNQREN